MTESYSSLIAKAREALRADETLVALVHLESASKIEMTPYVRAALGYCLAKERRQFQKALDLSRAAVHAEPTNPEHYFFLGRIYLLARKKRQAIASFRRGLKLGRYQPIIEELSRLGLRRDPVLTSLPREHALNRILGQVMARLGLR